MNLTAWPRLPSTWVPPPTTMRPRLSRPASPSGDVPLPDIVDQPGHLQTGAAFRDQWAQGRLLPSPP